MGRCKTKWYRRSGARVSEARVAKAKAAHAESFRTGISPLGLRCKIDHRMAAAVTAMDLIQWANYTGAFTYKHTSQGARP